MAEHLDPGNKSPEQVEAEEIDCWRKSKDGYTVREIAHITGLSKSVVARRISDSILGQEMPSRDAMRIMESERLDRYTRALHRDLDTAVGDPAKLVPAAVAVSKARRALWGLDEPTRKAVTVTNTSAEQEPPSPWLSDELAKWKQSDLYRADLEAAGRTEADDAKEF